MTKNYTSYLYGNVWIAVVTVVRHFFQAYKHDVTQDVKIDWVQGHLVDMAGDLTKMIYLFSLLFLPTFFAENDYLYDIGDLLAIDRYGWAQTKSEGI